MAATLITIAQIYTLIGAAVAIIFLVWGIGRIDANARGAWAFRPLIAPGVMLLWPLVLIRWARLAAGWNEALRYLPPRRAQIELILLLAAAVPLIVITAIIIRQDASANAFPADITPGEDANE